MVKMLTDNFFVKTLVFFFVVICVVVAEHQKRDVHRIILQHRVPRNHNKGHAHNHGRKQESKYKKAKLESQELYPNSFEDSGSYSNENSFENYHHLKTHKPSTKKSPKSHRHHIYTNLDVQESRNRPPKKTQYFYNEWLPSVDYDHLTSNIFSQMNREKDETKRKSKKNTFRNVVPEDFHDLINLPHQYINPYKELTNSHNLNLEQSFKKGIPYESSTLYPPIDVLSTFSELNKKTLENNTSITFDDNIQKDTLNALKNQNIINYDNNNDNESSDKDLGYIVVPEKSDITSSENIPNKLNSKNRGSIRFNEEFQS